MPRKKSSQQQIEQREFKVLNPDDIKQSVEILEKPRPKIEDLEIVEKIGKAPKEKIKKTGKKPAKNISSNELKLNPKGYILIITEKPQAALKIASALGEGREIKKSENGVPYYEFYRNNKKIVVACAVGHLFTVSQTRKGTDYPIFEIGWFPNFEVKKKDFTKKYYNLIKRLVKGASEIIVATDYDVEGEVIGYNIIRFIANQKDAKRMKFSSLTVEELQDSYNKVNQTIDWGQAIAGETRHFVDWLYGINLSRALMNSIKSAGKFKIMSIGRVQGPTLNLIVEKEKEIQKFKSTPYWQVFAKITDGKNTTELKYVKDITKKQDINKFEELKGKNTLARTVKTNESIIPPPPFDLTTLQTESYAHFSLTPAQTLQIAQKLYLAGIISYPRTSSQKIPDAIEPKKILNKLSKHFEETSHAIKEKPIEGKKTDPAHPAIIPTGIFTKLERDEEKIYNLIAKRFISCFCDSAELENKKVEMEIEGLKFYEKGIEILKPGWMSVYPAKVTEKEIKDFNGEVKIENIRTEEKQTQPPKRFSPASIISELEKRNLGTKATRSSIIETLYDREYIKEKSIKPTELGIKLIDTLKKFSEIIIDEKLTREIEKDMENIRSSKKDLNKKKDLTLEKAKTALKKISNDFKKNETKIGESLIEANNNHWEQKKEDSKIGMKCPACKSGDLLIKYSPRFKSYFMACSNYPECKNTFSLPGNSLIKKANKNCEECSFPMLISIKRDKRPWIFCFNRECPKRQFSNANNNSNDTTDNNSNNN